MCEGLCVLLHVIIGARTQSRILTRALKIRLLFSIFPLSLKRSSRHQRQSELSHVVTSFPLITPASHPGAQLLPPFLDRIPYFPLAQSAPGSLWVLLRCSSISTWKNSEVHAPDQGISWTSLRGGVLNMSSWKETRRSSSGPGEAGGEGGLVLDYQWKMERTSQITASAQMVVSRVQRKQIRHTQPENFPCKDETKSFHVAQL